MSETNYNNTDCFNNILREIIENSKKHAKISSNPDDYTDSNDGLLHCGVCHTAKQCKVNNFMAAETTTVNCMCQCETEKYNKEQEHKEYENFIKRKENSKIPSSFFDADFSIIKDEKKKTYGINYAKNFETIGFCGLLLYGDVGTGKSYMAASIANALMGNNKSVRWLSATHITEISSFFNESEYENYLQSIARPDLLIIDDLGAERGTDYALQRVHTLIDYRINSGKPVLITTNLEIKEMMETEDTRKKRTYDRIFKSCFPIAFHGTSFRQKQAKANFDKIQMILSGEV